MATKRIKAGKAAELMERLAQQGMGPVQRVEYLATELDRRASDYEMQRARFSAASQALPGGYEGGFLAGALAVLNWVCTPEMYDLPSEHIKSMGLTW